MSAFIVDDKTVNRILAQLRCSWESGGHGTTPYPPDDMPQPADPRDYADAAREVGQQMRDLNVAAVQARYPGGGDLPGPHPLLPYEYQYVPPAPLVATIKSLRCFLYQCSEGTIPERPLFKKLELWMLELSAFVVGRLPEYDAAPWD